MALEEHASPVATAERDLEMELVLDDCRRAFSGMVHEEKMLEVKRRWLMASPLKMKNTHKRLTTSRFFRNVYLPESFVRSDDACLRDIRMLVQRGFRSSAENTGFKKTHPELGEIIEESPSEFLEQSHSGDFERVNMLSRILSHITVLNPISSSLSSPICKILEGLEVFPSLALIAMNRKLKVTTVTPQFPVVFSCKRNILIERLRKKCHKMLSTLKNGEQLPKSLAKALSVTCLSIKQITRQFDMVTTIFFPFTPDVEDLQNEILNAIWSLPNVKLGELKHLQYLISPSSNLPPKSLRRSFHNYLMEYLFHCDEVHVPKPLLMALKLINKRSQCQLLDAEVTAEVESILTVSSQLRQVIWDLFPNEDIDQEYANAYAEGLGEDGCDIVIDESEDCSSFGFSDYLQICESDDEGEATGDSMPVDSCLIFSSENKSSAQLSEGKGVTCNSKDEQQRDQNGSSTELCHQPTKTNISNRYLALQNICDETSLVAYRLIGHIIEELVHKEGKAVDEETELYLKGGASSSSNREDPEKAHHRSENLEATILQVIGETMPSFPNSVVLFPSQISGMDRVKELMKLL